MKKVCSLFTKYVLIVVMYLLILLPFILEKMFGTITFEQIVYHLVFLDDSFNLNSELCFKIMYFTAFILIASIPLLFYLRRFRIILGLLLIAFMFCLCTIGTFKYVYYAYIDKNDPFIENHYVDPLSNHYHFPKQKKNIIVIVMESMEKNFENYQGENLIPNLSHLQKEYISFNGFEQLPQAGWTQSALVSMQTGMPVKFPGLNSVKYLLPKATSFADILKQNGYYTEYTDGADLNFMNVGHFMRTHGFLKVSGLKEWESESIVNPKINIKDRKNDYGLQDSDLYNISKVRLEEIKNKKRPFLYVMLTLDTHHPCGYLSKGCKVHYNDIRDSILCADRQVFEFLNWIKKQDFYKDTVVVIVGDHLQMESSMSENLNKKKRETLALIINSPLPKPKNQERLYTTLDLAPTILEAAGIHMSTHQFGLGVSLFSENKTLPEKYGYENFSELIWRPSDLYNSLLDEN